MNRDIKTFVKNFVSEIENNTAAIFAGAGLSSPAGFVNWAELLTEIAEDLHLDIKLENDLVSLAQYHSNENNGNHKISQKIVEEFGKSARTTTNHKILSRLPISTFWTTNYDNLIETSLREAGKIVDVKHQPKQLAITKPKRDVVVLKMHGDADHSQDAILTRKQYEVYYQSHAPFTTALNGDLVSKTFLFIGFSFSDPNINYILSRLVQLFGEDKRQHFFFVKSLKLGDPKCDDKASLDYQKIKQELMIGDLKRYGIKALIIEEYSEITDVLLEIEKRFLKKTVFISGSADEYGDMNKNLAQSFIHVLSKRLILSGFTVVNGFGWGIGSAVINGALDAIRNNPSKTSESQLVVRPFPQFETGDITLPKLWEEYRQDMLSLTGVSVFIFGNKNKDGRIVNADGVRREFEIAREKNMLLIPIGATMFESKKLWQEIIDNFDEYYSQFPNLKETFSTLGDKDLLLDNYDKIVDAVVSIINEYINK